MKSRRLIIQSIGNKIEIACDLLKTARVQCTKMMSEFLARIDATHIREGKHFEVRKFRKSGPLQRYNLGVVKLRHIVIGESISRFVIDLKARIELQHIQQLKQRKRLNKKCKEIHFKDNTTSFGEITPMLVIILLVERVEEKKNAKTTAITICFSCALDMVDAF